MSYTKQWLKIFGLLLTLLFTPLQLNAITFDWQTEGGGWTPGALFKAYTNVAGSGLDMNVTITGDTGEFQAGFPNDDADGLNLRVNYTNEANSVTLTMTFSKPVKISSLKLKDFDTNTYRDRAIISGIDTAGNTVFPSGVILGSGTHQNAIGDYEANAGTTVGPGDASGQVDVQFNNVAITSLSWRYNNGVDADTNPAQQFLWIDPVLFEESSPTLSIVKTSSASGGPVLPGSIITYTIVVTNAGAASGDATQVTVSDVLPLDVTLSGTPQKTYFVDGGATSNTYNNTSAIAVPDNACPTETSRIINVPDSVVITDLDIGFNMTHPFKGDMEVFVTSPQGTKVQLLNQLGGGNNNIDVLFDSDSSNNNGTLNGNHVIAAPLYDNVGQPLNSLDVFDGENASGNWSISFCDDGNADLGTFNQARLNISFLSRVTTTDVANSPVNMVVSGDNITLRPSETLTVEYNVTVDADIASNPLTNTGTANSNETSNISDTAIDTVNLNADLVTVKTVNNATPQEGDSVTFTILVTNNGTAQATNVDLNDTLPAGVTFSSASASHGSYTAPVWTIGTLANGEVAELNITVTVD